MTVFLEKISAKIINAPKDLLRSSHTLWSVISDVFLPYTLDKATLLLLFLSRHKYEYQTDDKHIITVVCHRDVAAYLIAVKSLIYHSKKNFLFYAVNDGSLTSSDKNLISSHHTIQIIDIPEKDRKKNQSFKLHWQNIKYLEMNKIFSPKKIYYMDSDIIFFRNPEFFINNNFDIVYMEDFKSRYSFSECELDHYLHLNPMNRVNTGMFSLPSQYISEELVKKLVKMEKLVLQSRHVEDHYLEQTAYALLFGQLNKIGLSVSKLPKEYFLLARNKFLNTEIPENLVCLHYASWFANLRRRDNLKVLIKTFLFWRIHENK